MSNDTPMLDVLSGPRGKFSVHLRCVCWTTRRAGFYEFDNDNEAREFVMGSAIASRST